MKARVLVLSAVLLLSYGQSFGDGNVFDRARPGPAPVAPTAQPGAVAPTSQGKCSVYHHYVGKNGAKDYYHKNENNMALQGDCRGAALKFTSSTTGASLCNDYTNYLGAPVQYWIVGTWNGSKIYTGGRSNCPSPVAQPGSRKHH